MGLGSGSTRTFGPTQIHVNSQATTELSNYGKKYVPGVC